MKDKAAMPDIKKVIVVTGASKGLGGSIVKAFRGRGYCVITMSRSIQTSTDPDLVTVAGDIGDIAQAVLYPEDAAFVTGQTLYVDGACTQAVDVPGEGHLPCPAAFVMERDMSSATSQLAREGTCPDKDRTSPKPRIAVIVGSTRPGRLADKAAQWMLRQTQARGDMEVELVDLRGHPLPFFEEVASNRWAPSRDPEALRWQATVARFGDFIFVVAEYNHSITGMMKNALDQSYKECNHKTFAAIASA